MSIIALGVGPYITASIVIQLLQMDIVPIFKKWSEEGETGKQKINQASRYIAIVLAFVQALTMTIAFHEAIFGAETVTAVDRLYLAILITAGTAFLIWLGDQITKKGIGNGLSMIIVSGIIVSFPQMFLDLYEKFIKIGGQFKDYTNFILIISMFVAVILGVIFIQESSRKINVQYSNRQVSAKNSNIPIKINSAGVIPVIFAVTLLTLPALLIQATNALNWTDIDVLNTEGNFWFSDVFNIQRPIGYLIYTGLIFVFGIFYAFLQVNPQKISENLQKQNAFIPGVRPGEETASYVSKVLFKVSLVGALFLIVVASLPLFTTIIFDLPSSVQIGGTSMLIVVGVAMETAKQIATQLSEKTYKGFLR